MKTLKFEVFKRWVFQIWKYSNVEVFNIWTENLLVSFLLYLLILILFLTEVEVSDMLRKFIIRTSTAQCQPRLRSGLSLASLNMELTIICRFISYPLYIIDKPEKAKPSILKHVKASFKYSQEIYQIMKIMKRSSSSFTSCETCSKYLYTTTYQMLVIW